MHSERLKIQANMAQPMLAPVPRPASAFKQQLCQRYLPAVSTSLLVRQHRLQARSMWQTTPDVLADSCGLDMRMVKRDDLGMWSLSRFAVTLEQEKSMRQKQEYYLNYGRALRIIRDDIPK